MKEMNILSINDQDFEVVDGAGRSGLADLEAYTGGGSLIGTASADCFDHEMIEIDAADAPVHKCVFDLPVRQAGIIGVDPTPENPKEFFDYQMLSIDQMGENLFVLEDSQQGYYLDDQGNAVQRNGLLITDFIEVSGSVYYGFISSLNDCYCAWYNENKVLVSTFALELGTRSLTVPSGVKYVRISFSDIDLNGFYVSVTEPFSDFITLSSFYHGTVDVLTGTAVQPDVLCTLQDQQDLAFTMTESADYTTFSTDITDYFPTVKADGFAIIYCDKFKGYDSDTPNTNNIFLEDGVLNIRVEKNKWASASDFLDWVRINGINMLIELETAQVDQVGTIPLHTISGMNTIQGNFGTLEIEYYKNTTIVSDFITLINDLYPEE